MNWMGLADSLVSTAANPLAPLAANPELASRYHSFLASIAGNSQVSARWLELIERRIGYIHGQQLSSPIHLLESEDVALAAADFDAFSEEEQSILAVIEQIPFAYHQISDSEMARMSDALNPQAVVVILAAASFYDVNCRLAICWQQGQSEHV